MHLTSETRRPSAWLALAALTLAVAAPLALGGPAAPERSYIDHPPAPNGRALPFSDAVRLGDTLYVAGHIGIDPRTGNAAASPETEARLVMDAVKHTLERAGFTMDDFVSVTVYCTDLALYDTFNGIYGGYFHGHHPARAFIGVSKLVRGARFEVQGVAVRTGRP
ncbi:MAG TPA: Rid family hydrolase [Steroidobacteraceae bacterium]|nr:Rid family hydrolase [Steroidobacteraceae bacterium]